jgi:hypothetical protein
LSIVKICVQKHGIEYFNLSIDHILTLFCTLDLQFVRNTHRTERTNVKVL